MSLVIQQSGELGSQGVVVTKPRGVSIDGSVEVLKWLALVLMTVDHVNKYLFNGVHEWATDVGRIAMPLFVLVLAWNLARTEDYGVALRVVKRTLIFGLIAEPVMMALGWLKYGWWPLNIMFTLATIAAVVSCMQRSTSVWVTAGVIVGLAAGAVVEFQWPAILLGVGAWWFFRTKSLWAVALIVWGFVGIEIINQSGWAWMAPFVAWMVIYTGISVPKVKWWFYGYYPAHLACLWLIQIPMRKVGYLFFG